MDIVSKALEGKCGVPSSSIQRSIIETAKSLDISTLQVCTSILERMATYKMKVISWNCLADIWYGDSGEVARKRFQKVLDTLLGMIKTYDPDVILLQEVTKSKYLIFKRRFKGYTSHVSYHSAQYWHTQLKLPYQPNGTCIFIKKKFEPVTFSNNALGRGNFDSAVTLSLASRPPAPGGVHIINVHLNDKDIHHVREQEIKNVLELLDPTTTYIIGGDLNSKKGEQVHSILTSKGFETACFGECDIDYIYVRKGDGEKVVMVPLPIENPSTNVETLIKEKGSDHPPVGIEIFII